MENLTELIGYILLFYFAYRVGQIISAGYKEAMMEDAKSKLIAKKIHVLKVEKHNDTFYWFDTETDQFIAQGKGIPDFVAVLKQVHSDKVFLFNDYCFAGPDFMPIFIKDSVPPEQLL